MSEITEAQKKKLTENFLKGYSLNQKMIKMERYEKEFFSKKERDTEFLGEIPLARARMFEVRHFINELKNGDQKLLLYFHYIKGESVERCGELLGISRSSAYRLKSQALLMAYEKLSKKNIL